MTDKNNHILDVLSQEFKDFLSTGKLNESKVTDDSFTPTVKESDDNDEDDDKIYEGIDKNLVDSFRKIVSDIRMLKSKMKSTLKNDDFVEYMKCIDSLETLSGKM